MRLYLEGCRSPNIFDDSHPDGGNIEIPQYTHFEDLLGGDLEMAVVYPCSPG